MNRYSHTALAWVVLVWLLSGCAQQAPIKNPPLDETALVWPSAPQTPRIQHLYNISQAQDILVGGGWFKKTMDFLKGRKDQKISSPYGLEVDAEGRLYVVDVFYKAVHVFDTVRDKHYLFPEEPIEGFLYPIDIALGSNGRIYVSDSGSNLVHVFTDQGKKYQQSFGQGQFERPTGLTVNKSTGELLVLDTTASQLVVYDEQSLAIKRVTGKESEASEGYHYPTNATTAKDGVVYVTDSLNYRVQVLGPDLTFRKHFGTAGDSPGHFSRPKGIATDSDKHVYVVDALFDNVQIFDSEGQLLLAFGTSGSDRGEFWLPNAIFIDDHDRIYVSDSHNHRVQVFQYLKKRVEQL